MTHQYVLLAAGPDVVGLRASVESWMRGNNAVAATNFRVFGDSEGTVFLRAEFTCPTGSREKLEAAFRSVAAQWRLADWRIQIVSKPKTPTLAKPRVMVLVSKVDHCLAELLALQAKGVLPGLVVAVAGNHTGLQDDVERAGVPFTHIPWPAAAVDSAGHEAAHAQLLQLVKTYDVDVLVLARFMQVVRAEVCELVPTINAHHSLLPAFVGARPYHQAHERGVKEIGATAHYVTPELDEGPIIAQTSSNVEHLGPCPTPGELAVEGRMNEVRVLVTALERHCRGELLRYRGGTVRISP